METEFVDYDDEEIAILVTDERELNHQIAMDWSGAITYHGTDEYPHEPEDRTDDEQRIMSQVEERARYAAQQEFPEADILDPMWNIDHVERGIEALSNYPIEDFRRVFREYYDALRAPWDFIEEPAHDPEDELVLYPFAITEDNRIAEVGDVCIVYDQTDGTEEIVGEMATWEEYDRIVCILPSLDFGEGVTFEEGFHEIVLGHLMAVVRDLYLHMGESPPDEFNVEGIGKFDIHGDGIGET
ncbi:hypothetical protein [Halorhabdus salina]|uniref:hypothetical protein n=1 Tax=Halorhabdus salina TaxID=2750670 RepID=UPI0015EEF573|nr:hypothetical protein [Halorhabdus salina]